MITLDQVYKHMSRPGPHSDDIIEHLPTLTTLASQCDHVTEMGFRVGTSFAAILKGKPKKAISYDIAIADGVKHAWSQLKTEDTDFQIIEADTREIEIEETDMLFIDTLHTYDQLKTELELHGDKARKYLVFHDTVTFGQKGEDGKSPGLLRAIEQFILKDCNWLVSAHHKNNNGLMILERV